MTMAQIKTYTVTASLKNPGHSHTGYEFEICAGNKAKAIKQARSMVWTHGHTRQDGALIFTAVEVG